mgnify:CR=1 FL=1
MFNTGPLLSAPLIPPLLFQQVLVLLQAFGGSQEARIGPAQLLFRFLGSDSRG